MNTEYQFYCTPGTPFYDKVEPTTENRYHIEAPTGWEILDIPDWKVYLAPAKELPEQGWKIHVTANLANAEHILDAVAHYCFQTETSFKHMPCSSMLFMKNSKYADRGTSGKFITIFPKSDNDALTILYELDTLIGGQEGPYILSDLRWNNGPLFVRYGAFRMMYEPQVDGAVTPCIRKPTGELVPDVRKPGRYCPEWVELPSFLEDSVRRRNASVIQDFPFRILRALHFSNGGGVYKAESLEDGRQLVLKEARPFAGLDNAGDDACARLERERAALEHLRGVEGVPELISFKKGYENNFLVREYVEGQSLMSLIYEYNPILVGQPWNKNKINDYKEWALKIAENVDYLVSRVHERGLVLGDLHPNNILVHRDDSISAIDFETSSDDVNGYFQKMAAPGFNAPEEVLGVDVDWYSYGALCLTLFVPIPQVMSWHNNIDKLLEYADGIFSFPNNFIMKIRRCLGQLCGGVPSTATQANNQPLELSEPCKHAMSLKVAIEKSATLDRQDRLFPGDISQFTELGGGLSFLSGAAGVLWAMNRLGWRNQEHTNWLLANLNNVVDLSSSFAKGGAGIIYSLNELDVSGFDYYDSRRMVSQVIQGGNVSLSSGISGVGLTLLSSAMRNDELSLDDSIYKIASALRARISEVPTANLRTGYWNGLTGIALFFLRMYQWNSNDEDAKLALWAWNKDVDNLIERHHAVSSNAHHRPIDFSIASGAAGMTVVGRKLADELDNAKVSDRIEELASLAISAPVVAGSSILYGLSGAVLAAVGSQSEAVQVRSKRLLSAIDQFRVNFEGHDAYLGQELLRISMDYGTGTAGLALALRDYDSGVIESLPFVSDIDFQRR